jgi:hypothetical protein
MFFFCFVLEAAFFLVLFFFELLQIRCLAGIFTRFAFFFDDEDTVLSLARFGQVNAVSDV